MILTRGLVKIKFRKKKLQKSNRQKVQSQNLYGGYYLYTVQSYLVHCAISFCNQSDTFSTILFFSEKKSISPLNECSVIQFENWWNWHGERQRDTLTIDRSKKKPKKKIEKNEPWKQKFGRFYSGKILSITFWLAGFRWSVLGKSVWKNSK